MISSLGGYQQSTGSSIYQLKMKMGGGKNPVNVYYGCPFMIFFWQTFLIPFRIDLDFFE